jgi:hypothetical protein
MNDNPHDKSPTAPDNVPGVQTKLKDITGQRFGRLVVLRREGKNISEQATWRCLCDCGKETVVAGITLRKKIVVSCGCYHAEVTKKLFTTHGHSQTGIYRSYKEMVRRCTKPGHIEWATYGGRGIKVCERWMVLENFIADMMATWKEGLSIDRINPDGDYCPENCRWATSIEQNNNKRNNVRVEYNGETLTLAQWARKLGMSLQAFRDRLKNGWTVKEAIETPPMKYKTRKQKPQ